MVIKKILMFFVLLQIFESSAQLNVVANVDHVIPWSSDTQGNIFLAPSGGRGYTYTWTPGNSNSRDLTNATPNSYTVNVSGGGTLIRYYNLGYKTRWQDFIGTKFRNDTLMSDGLGSYTNRVAVTKNTLLGNTNGWAEFVHPASYSPYVIGFLDSTSAAALNTAGDFDFAFHVSTGNALYSCIGGNFTYLGTVATGDVLRAERIGSVFYLKVNAATSYTAAAIPQKKLKVKANMLTVPLANIGVSFADSSEINRMEYLDTYVDNIKQDNIDSLGNVYPKFKYGQAPFQYKWRPGNTTSKDLVNAKAGTYTLTIKDANNDSIRPVVNLGYSLLAKNLYGTSTTFINDTLQANAAGTPTGSSSGAGTNELKASTDGWLQLAIQDFQAPYVVGFSDSIKAPNKGDINDIVFAFHVSTNNALYSWYGGAFTSLGTVKKGDIMSAHRIGSTYYIKKNNVSIFSASANQTKILRPKVTLNSNSYLANIGASFTIPKYVTGIQKTHCATNSSQDGYASITRVAGTKLIWNDGSVNAIRTNLVPGSYTVYTSNGNQTAYAETPVQIGVKPSWILNNNINVTADSMWTNNTDSLGRAVSSNLTATNSVTWFEGAVKNSIHDFVIGFIGVTDTTAINPISQNSLIKQRIDSCYALFDKARNGRLSVTGSDSTLSLTNDYSSIHLLRIFNGRIKSLINGSSYKSSYYYKAGDVLKIGRDANGKIYISINDRTFYTHSVNRNSQFLYPVMLTGSGASFSRQGIGAGSSTVPNCSPPPNGFYAVVPSGPSGSVCIGANTSLSSQLNSVTFGGIFGPYYTPVTTGVVYSWQPNNQSGQNITVSPVANQNYIVSASYNGCVYTNQVTVNVSNLAANAGPDYFLQTFPSGALNIGFNPTALGGVSPYSYNWTSSPTGLTLSNSTISNPLINSITSSFGASTVYNVNVVVTDASGCTASDNLKVFDISGTNSVHYAILNRNLDAGYYNSINNGSSNMFYFTFNEEYYSASGTSLTYQVLHDNGTVQSLPGLVENIGDNRFALNVSGLTVGSYYKIFVYNQKKEVWQGRIKVN